MTAARIIVAQKAYFLILTKVSFVTNPIADSAATTVGNSNTIPKTNTMDVRREMYEFNVKAFCISSLT